MKAVRRVKQQMTAARVKLTPLLERLLTDQMALAIEQANLGTFGTFVAKKYFIEQVPQTEIAEELGYDRTVISRRIKTALPRVEHAAQMLFGNKHTTEL